MPNATVYIKKEDWEAWSSITNKSEWIHEGIRTGFVIIPAKSVSTVRKDPSLSPKAPKFKHYLKPTK